MRVSLEVKLVSNVIPSSWFSSAVEAVRAVLSARTEAVPDCIPASVVSSPSAILSVVIALLAILADVTELFAKSADTIVPSAILADVI